MKGTTLKRLMGYLFNRQRGKITIVLVSQRDCSLIHWRLWYWRKPLTILPMD